MKPRFAFICSAGHSGSTLLNLMLGAHTDAIAVGEVTQLPKNIALNSECACGNCLSECAFWQPLITDLGSELETDLWSNPYRLNMGFIMAGREIDHNHQTKSRMLWRKIVYGAEYGHIRWRLPRLNGLHRVIRDAAESKRDFFEFLSRSTGHHLVVDSSKHYLEGMSLFDAAPDQTRVILLCRDGRAVFNSGLRHGFAKKAALNAWYRPNRRSLHAFTNRLPKSAWLIVRYEDLATDPDHELARISRFLEVENSPAMLKFAGVEQHIVAGNQMRFSKDSAVRLDERWRRELPTPMLQYFERRAGHFNRELGYDG